MEKFTQDVIDYYNDVCDKDGVFDNNNNLD